MNKESLAQVDIAEAKLALRTYEIPVYESLDELTTLSVPYSVGWRNIGVYDLISGEASSADHPHCFKKEDSWRKALMRQSNRPGSGLLEMDNVGMLKFCPDSQKRKRYDVITMPARPGINYAFELHDVARVTFKVNPFDTSDDVRTGLVGSPVFGGEYLATSGLLLGFVERESKLISGKYLAPVALGKIDLSQPMMQTQLEEYLGLVGQTPLVASGRMFAIPAKGRE